MFSNISIMLHCFSIKSPILQIISSLYQTLAKSLHILGFAPEIIKYLQLSTIHNIFESFALPSLLTTFPHHCVTALANLADITFSENFVVSYQLLYNKSSSNLLG